MTVKSLVVALAVLLGKEEPCAAAITTDRTNSSNTHLLRRQLVEETTSDANESTIAAVSSSSIVKYSGTMGMTCQRKFNIPGEVDINYTLVRNLTLKGCMEACSAANDVTQKKGSSTSTTSTDDANNTADSSEEVDYDQSQVLPFCAGYQHTTLEEGTTECHLWYHYGPGEGEEDPNSVCFWKVVSNPTQQCCVPTLQMETELCANEVGTVAFSSVQCGPNQCEYDNYCLALVTGHFHQEECMEQCAEPMNAYNCDGQLFSPVQCMTKGAISSSRSNGEHHNDGESVLKCTYDNLCLAQQAGYTTLDSVCEDVCPTIIKPNDNMQQGSTVSSFTCAVDDSSTSTFGSATRSTSTSCEGNTTSTTTMSNAAVASGGAATNGVVLCGTHQCPYDTICDGIKAGFAQEQCVPI